MPRPYRRQNLIARSQPNKVSAARVGAVLMIVAVSLIGAAAVHVAKAQAATASNSAAVRYHWGPVNSAQSDEYHAESVDLDKWGLFGASPGQSTGCAPGFNGHGERCAGQTTEHGGYLTVQGTASGRTGGLYSTHGDFKYGRVEIRERAVPNASNGGAPWHAVSLLFRTTMPNTRTQK